MKKFLRYFLMGSFGVLLTACYDANSQNDSTVVGNPDSANLMIMEEGYEAVVVPNNSQQNQETAPSMQQPSMPQNTSPATSQTNPSASATQENTTDSSTPDNEEIDEEIDIEETSMQN